MKYYKIVDKHGRSLANANSRSCSDKWIQRTTETKHIYLFKSEYAARNYLRGENIIYKEVETIAIKQYKNSNQLFEKYFNYELMDKNFKIINNQITIPSDTQEWSHFKYLADIKAPDLFLRYTFEPLMRIFNGDNKRFYDRCKKHFKKTKNKILLPLDCFAYKSNNDYNYAGHVMPQDAELVGDDDYYNELKYYSKDNKGIFFVMEIETPFRYRDDTSEIIDKLESEHLNLYRVTRGASESNYLVFEIKAEYAPKHITYKLGKPLKKTYDAVTFDNDQFEKDLKDSFNIDDQIEANMEMLLSLFNNETYINEALQLLDKVK